MSEHGLVVVTGMEPSEPVEQPIVFTSPPERIEDQEDPHLHTLRDLRTQLDDTHIDGHNIALRNAQLVRAHLRQAINEPLKTHPHVHKCPPEILAHIFWYYTRLGLDSKKRYLAVEPHGPFQVFETATGPWPLGQVCREWRTIAWDTPRLWSSFSLDWEGFDEIPESRQPDVVNMFTEVFARTKQAPLAVNINFLHDPWVHTFFDHIAREAHRLEELALSGTAEQLTRGLTTLFPRLPALKSLTLTAIQKDGLPEDHSESGPIARTFAPQLIRLDASCQYYPPLRIALPPLPYAQLRHLNIGDHHDGPLPFTLSALEKCKNLETYHDLNQYCIPCSRLEISLNHLKVISLRSPSLLDWITAPALTTLLLPCNCNMTYYSDIINVDTILGAVIAFQERSQCRIDTAFLHPLPPSIACKNFLRGFADLRTLAIKAWKEDRYTSSFISLLNRDPEETFMPHLDTLNVCLSATPHLTCLLDLQQEPRDTAIEVALAQVIASRRSAPPDQPMLQAVNIIYICPGWDNDLDPEYMFTAVTATTFYKTLCDLEREGLALCVDYLPDQEYFYWTDIFDRTYGAASFVSHRV